MTVGWIIADDGPLHLCSWYSMRSVETQRRTQSVEFSKGTQAGKNFVFTQRGGRICPFEAWLTFDQLRQNV